MANTLLVKNTDGRQINIDVIDIIEDTVDGQQYVCYTIADMDKVFVSHLILKDNNYILETVTDEKRKQIEEVLSQNMVNADE